MYYAYIWGLALCADLGPLGIKAFYIWGVSQSHVHWNKIHPWSLHADLKSFISHHRSENLQIKLSEVFQVYPYFYFIKKEKEKKKKKKKKNKRKEKRKNRASYVEISFAESLDISTNESS